MSTIRCIYSAAPNFPAIDQHPAAVRFYRLLDDSIVTQLPVGASVRHVIDATDGAPVLAEVLAFLNPSPPSVDELEAAAIAALNGGQLAGVDLRKLLKAIVINFTARALGVAPGALTPAQLQTERARIAAIFKNL